MTKNLRSNQQKFITFRDCRIVFRNFSGKPGEFNRDGRRTFCLLLDSEVAKTFQEDGWNVKFLRPRDEGDEPQPYIEVKVNFNSNGRPPKVVMITSGGNTMLTEETVGLLDFAEITHVDLNIHPYNYSVRGETGVTAYVRDLYVTVEEDELEMKYRDTPDSALKSIVGFDEVDHDEH